jgi:hypothetical protein
MTGVGKFGSRKPNHAESGHYDPLPFLSPRGVHGQVLGVEILTWNEPDCRVGQIASVL